MTEPLILDRAALDAALAALPPEAACCQPILEAIRDFGLVHARIAAEDRLPKMPANLMHRPALFIIADDFDVSQGPDAFHRKSLLRALDGCACVVIHGAAPEAQHYGAAVVAALLTGKAAIIETQPKHETAWLRFVGRHAPQAAQLVITSQSDRWSREGGTA